MKTFEVLILCVSVAAGVSSCDEHSVSPHDSGAIAGHVALFDSSQAALPDFSGATVSIDGSDRNTLTDSVGHFSFTGLAEGTYSLTAAKPGFGTFHWFQVEVNNGEIDLSTGAIARMGFFAPRLIQAGWAGGNLTTTVSDSGAPRYYRTWVYCDADSTTAASAPHLLVSYTSDYFSISDLRASGARPGQVLYISASTVFDGDQYSGTFATRYFDPLHNQLRWASTGPRSNVIAVQMPQ